MIEIHCYIYMISVRFISIVSLLYEIIKSVSDIKRFCFIIICHAYHSDEQSILFFFFFFFKSLITVITLSLTYAINSPYN
jgi:hypothetical protein